MDLILFIYFNLYEMCIIYLTTQLFVSTFKVFGQSENDQVKYLKKLIHIVYDNISVKKKLKLILASLHLLRETGCHLQLKIHFRINVKESAVEQHWNVCNLIRKRGPRT